MCIRDRARHGDLVARALRRDPPDDVESKPVVNQTKHIFVTGGVASSLGKGLTASSLGHLLRARGLRVTMQKLDPYLNVGIELLHRHPETARTQQMSETGSRQALAEGRGNASGYEDMFRLIHHGL